MHHNTRRLLGDICTSLTSPNSSVRQQKAHEDVSTSHVLIARFCSDDEFPYDGLDFPRDN